MRLALVAETWLPSTDGVITRLRATVGELVRAGHHVLLIVPDGGTASRSDLSVEGALVRTVPTFAVPFVYGGKAWGLPALRVGRFLREFSPDVVHLLNPVTLGVAGLIAAKRQGRPLVASYHTDLVPHAAQYRVGWLRPVILGLRRVLHGLADTNLATSATGRATLIADGIADVQLWPQGVDSRLFSPAPRTPEQAERPRVALYVGRLAGEKGLHRLAALAAPSSGFHLVLVGDGPQRQELERAPDFATAEFTGVLEGEALAAAYRRADLFVFPSTTETLGLVLLEALASGLPVVAADSPASRDLLADFPGARLFPPDRLDLLLPLAEELYLRSRSGALALAARELAEQWTWERATDALVEFYRDTLVARPSCPN